MKGKIKKVEHIEIWMPVKEGGQAVRNGQNLKKIVELYNGKVIYLEKDFVIQKTYLSKEEVEDFNFQL